MTKPKSKPKTTGELIFAARTAAKLTQIELSTATGINQSDISKYELDKIEPEVATIKRLTAAMGVKVWELIGD